LTRVEKLLAELNDKLAGGPSEVVILPETVLEMGEGMFASVNPLSATPTAGATAKVTYNGAEYECSVLVPPDMPFEAYALGNTEGMGIAGGNADAPFAVIIMPTAPDGATIVFMPTDDPTAVTLSIVQVGAASGGESAGGGIFEVNVPVTKYNTSSGHDFGEFDKTFAELVAAHNAGKYVRINASWNIGYSTYGYVIGFGKSDGQDTFIVSMPASPTMPKQVAVYMLFAGDDGKITVQIMGAD
jgi:hypothetical protein